MRTYRHLIIAVCLLTLAACESSDDVVQPQTIDQEVPAPVFTISGSEACPSVWSAWIGPTDNSGSNSCDMLDYTCLDDCDTGNPVYHYEPTNCGLGARTVQLTRYGYPGHLGRTWVNFDFDTSDIPDDATITSAQIVLELFSATKTTGLTKSPLPTQCAIPGPYGLGADPVISGKLASVPSAGYVQPGPGETVLDYLNIECKLALWNITEFQGTSWNGGTVQITVPAGHRERINLAGPTRYAFDTMSLPPAQEFRVWEFYSHLDASYAPVMNVTYTQPDVVASSMAASTASGSSIDFTFTTEGPVLHAEIQYRVGRSGPYTVVTKDYTTATSSHSISVPCVSGWINWQARTYGAWAPSPAKKFLANCMF